MLPVCILVVLVFSCHGYVYRFQNDGTQRRQGGPAVPVGRAPKSQSNNISRAPNFNNTYFCQMPETAQRGALLLKESDYPWIARLLYGHRNNSRHMMPLACTAVNVLKQVFVTSARCIATAKAEFTTVLYRERYIGVKAFVTPSVTSKQLFDDLGLIVTWIPAGFKYNFTFVGLPLTTSRTSEPSFDFFETWPHTGYTVIGFVAQDRESPEDHKLYMLKNMHAGNTLCNKIYSKTGNSEDYRAPCVHSCSILDHFGNGRTCHRYLLGLGHAVLDSNNQLVGIVTWTCANAREDRANRNDLPMPLGIAVPKDPRIYMNLECADSIARDRFRPREIKPGYFKEQCDYVYTTRRPGRP